MSRRLTADPLLKKVPIRLNSGSSVTKNENAAASKDQPPKPRRPGGRIHPGYIDDQALVLTRYLPPDTSGSPRFRFYRLREPESRSQETAHKNSLIDSYYPTVECDCSEDQESQKAYFEPSSIQNTTNRFSNINVEHLQSGLKKLPIDSRTFTIYSCRSNSSTVPEVDNPRPEGHVDLEKSWETSSGLECFSELHKRIAKLEEKLQQTLEKSIEINEKKRQKSGSVQKLFQIVSGVLERNGKQKVQQTPDSEKSDTEDELRNIKKRLFNLEKKIKREKYPPGRDQLPSTTTNSSLLKENVDKESRGRSKIILKESDYTEPLHSDSEINFPKLFPPKRKKKMVRKEAKQVKQTFLAKCKIKRKSNLNKKISKIIGENVKMEKERFDKEVVLVNLDGLKLPCHGDSEPEWKGKLKKKKRKKTRNLCKKNSKTNILTEENRNVNEIPRNRESINSWTPHQRQKDWEPCACPHCPYRDLVTSMPFSPDEIDDSLRSSQKGSKCEKLQKSLYFFTPRASVKMPVFFEEILAKPKLINGAGKTSKVSMRFVLTHGKKNPLVTLRKLVKKLSQTHSSEAKYQ